MRSSTSIQGARIGKYRLLKHIATGGMGTVYKAYDDENACVVALKTLAADLASNPILVTRFRREGLHASRLDHKNIVRIFDSDEANGVPYLVMEYIEGVDLAEYVRRKGQVEPEEARRIIIQACKGLQHAFEQGIVHRDIKPSNFLLANESGRTRVKLTDLGLSRMSNEEDFRVTRAGTTVGTVDYMAPEQARDSTLADVRSDIYSLGCTLFHMLAGRPPFAEGGIGERVYKHMVADPPDVRDFNPSVPAGLWTVLRRMLAKHPDDRFQTPAELIDALRSISDIPMPEVETVMDGDSTSEANDSMPLPDAASVPPFTPLPQPVAPTPPPSDAEPPAPSPAAPANRPRKRRTTLAEMKTVPDPSADPLGVTVEQRQAAAQQYARATDLMRSGGEAHYIQHLLLSCCRLDPANLMYRKMLREVVRDQGSKRGWFDALTTYPARSRFKAAMRAGDHRKALEHGEELLTRLPGDVSAQLDMATAANALGLAVLAMWLLEEARAGAENDVTVLRALAALYAQEKRYSQAITVLERVRKLVPGDDEATAWIRQLAVDETLDRGRYRR